MDVLEGPVIVVVPGERESLRVLRLVASDVGRLLGFGYDAIEDSRLAVNEAASMLLAAGSGEIECQIGLEESVLTVEMSPDQPLDSWPPTDWEGSLGELVLSSVVDGLRLGSAPSVSFSVPPRR